jgi:Alpha/beta hydrolase domain
VDRDGVVPAKSVRFGADETGAFYRDSDHRVSGGVRLAAYDAPMSTSVGVNTGGGFCFLTGYHVDMTPPQLCARYGSQENYVAKVVEVTRRAEEDGYLLDADANRTIEAAKALTFTCP